MEIDYGVTASSSEMDTGTKFLRITDIQNDTVEWSSVPFCKAPENKLRSARLSDGDIVFARTGATTGKSFLIKSPPDGAVFASYLIRVKPSRSIDADYLAHFFRSSSYWSQIKKKTRGAAQGGVNATSLSELEIPIPPLDEQRRIAAILDKADVLRRKRRRTLELLDGLTQSIFLEMFGDPKSNPKGWDSLRLGDLCDVGSSKRVFVEEFVERGVPFYRGTEVGKLGAGQNIEPDLFIAPGHYDDLISHSGAPQVGDLLLPSICHDGRIWKVDNTEPFYFKDGRVLWIKSHHAQIDSEYLRSYLQNRFWSDYASIASGTTFAELKIINLKNLTILVPPIELQTEFSASMSAVQAMRRANKQSQATVDFLFSSLQHRAFSGQL
jgi:type I restriction enzyme S subunit